MNMTQAGGEGNPPNPRVTVHNEEITVNGAR